MKIGLMAKSFMSLLAKPELNAEEANETASSLAIKSLLSRLPDTFRSIGNWLHDSWKSSASSMKWWKPARLLMKTLPSFNLSKLNGMSFIKRVSHQYSSEHC
ncbi:hypothetical protein M977_02756 [Buttiauxella gaviniae ATCC 51604]|uniref:Uncharacterized protein n=1 Tax=Buttiauxella gaviniae ATCC 51604 TaxID=1354253 RepID=A0A1B7HX29_9ENTR|nr:hypothetical protein M977_02756 [Buttiauxella gaviniae ATCC 51604]